MERELWPLLPRHPRAASIGYQGHTIGVGRTLPEAWKVTPMNTCEKAVARRLIAQWGTGTLSDLPT